MGGVGSGSGPGPCQLLDEELLVEGLPELLEEPPPLDEEEPVDELLLPDGELLDEEPIHELLEDIRYFLRSE
ncbi:MAG: hypothetical protein Rhob2KO_29290 [Rhodopirellula baltica]